MDKLAKKLPLRENIIKAPVVFVANIPTSHYKAFGSEYYNPIYRHLKQQPNMSNFHLLLNVVNTTHTIEERAALLAAKVKQISANHSN